MIQQNSSLWNFFSTQEQMLARDGEFLLQVSKEHINPEPTDYSYLVFPFSKLYEGFMKDYFLRLGIITQREYTSDHFRIGKVLSPNLVRRLGRRSAYGQLQERYGRELPEKLWHAWKEGRNLVFHYFPHNYRVLTQQEAESTIRLLVEAMEEAVKKITM